MALRGTLKDFGIADIFQLIGHQGKTGELEIKNADETVQISFLDGNIVRASSATRDVRDRLGQMLVRAEVISQSQLDKALAVQRQTLQRLGEVLITLGAVGQQDLHELSRLQTTETVYRLFLWQDGTYEFSQGDVTLASGEELIRSENVLMEGFRQMDEWPLLRQHIPDEQLSFSVLDDLHALLAASAEQIEADETDDLFGGLDLDDEGPKDPRLRNIGDNERKVFDLIAPGRDVEKIVDLSRLGRFEATKALVNLLQANVISPVVRAARSGRPGSKGARNSAVAPVFLRGALYAGLLGVLLSAAARLDLSAHWHAKSAMTDFEDQRLQQVLATIQLQRLREAIDLYRVIDGDYPERLEQVVDAGLLEPADLQFPWTNPYYYSADGARYEVLRPLR